MVNQGEQQAELRQALINTFSQQEIWVMMSSSDAPFAAQPVGSEGLGLSRSDMPLTLFQ